MAKKSWKYIIFKFQITSKISPMCISKNLACGPCTTKITPCFFGNL